MSMSSKSMSEQGESLPKRIKREPSKVIYALNSDVRDQIVKRINNCTRLLCDDIDPGSKSEILREITRIIHTLLSLPMVKEQINEDHVSPVHVSPDHMSSDHSLSNHKLTDHKLPEQLNRAIEIPKPTNNQICIESSVDVENRNSTNLVEDLKAKYIMKEVDTKLSKVKNEILYLMRSRSEIIKTITLTNAFSSLTGEFEKSTQVFYVRNIPWRIAIRNWILPKDKKKKLMIFVYCDYEPSKNLNWRCDTRTCVKVLSNRCDIHELRRKFHFKFTKRQSVGTELITYDEKQYIINDSFSVQISLKCDQPILSESHMDPPFSNQSLEASNSV